MPAGQDPAPARPPRPERPARPAHPPDPAALIGLQGLARVRRAWTASRDGLLAAWRGEAAFRQELLLALLLLPATPWLARSWAEGALLVASVLLVLVVELLNSAIEAAIDRISPDWHELAKRAKDCGSAAVLLALLLCGGLYASLLLLRLTAATAP